MPTDWKKKGLHETETKISADLSKNKGNKTNSAIMQTFIPNQTNHQTGTKNMHKANRALRAHIICKYT